MGKTSTNNFGVKKPPIEELVKKEWLESVNGCPKLYGLSEEKREM